MPMFKFRGFTVKLSKTKNGYRYAGDNGTHHIAGPKPGSKEPLFLTPALAKIAAMNEIYSYVVSNEFCELPLLAQVIIGVVIEKVHDGELTIGPYDKIYLADCRGDSRKRNSR